MKTNVLKIRKKRGLTRKRLSELAGVGRGTLQNIEANDGDPRIGTMIKLANVLNIELNDLINFDEYKKN